MYVRISEILVGAKAISGGPGIDLWPNVDRGSESPNVQFCTPLLFYDKGRSSAEWRMLHRVKQMLPHNCIPPPVPGMYRAACPSSGEIATWDFISRGPRTFVPLYCSTTLSDHRFGKVEVADYLFLNRPPHSL
jgi:hypothetical protein